MPRTALLQQMAREIIAIERDHPVRVAIDGPGAAGKTTLADELVEQIEAHGRPVIRATIDELERMRAHVEDISDSQRRGVPLLRMGVFVLMRSQMLGIQDRAEQGSVARPVGDAEDDEADGDA